MASGDTPARRRRDLIELSLGYALIIAVIWTPRPLQRLLFWLAASGLISVLWLTFPGWEAMGLRSTNLARSLWVAGAALLAAAIAIFIAGRMHTLQWPGGTIPFVQRYLGYAIWSVFQQVLLQDYFLARLLRLLGRPVSAALAAATIFSLAHLPNPILTLVTFIWGLAACLLFLRYRNLYPLALAHAILGIAIAMTVPGPVTHNMRVGLGYLTYSAHPMHYRNH
jgi:membrane protease YdiL (CAAX protease family)